MPTGTFLVLALLAQDPTSWLREDEHRLPGGAVRAALAPATRSLATVGRDNEIRIWRPCTDDPVCAWKAGDRALTALEFSPDGRSLVSADASGRITFWDPDSGKSQATLEAGVGIAAFRFAPDGSMVFAAAADGAPKGWHALTRAALPAFAAGSRPLRTLAVGPRRIAAGDDRGGIRIWDRTGGAIRTETTAPRPSTVLAFSPDGKTLAAAAPDGLRLWSADLQARPRFVAEPGITVIGFSPDGGHLYAGVGGGRVMILEVEGGTWIGGNPGLDAPILAMALAGNTLFLAGSDGSADEIRTDDGSAVCSRRGPRTPVRRLAASASGHRLAAGDARGRVSLWDVDGNKFLWELTETGSFTRGLAVSPRGDRVLAEVKGGKAVVRNADTGAEEGSWSMKDATVASLGFSTDGPTAIFRSKSWELLSISGFRSLVPHPDAGSADPFFCRVGDRHTVASRGSKGGWTLHDAWHGDPLLVLGEAERVAVSPDGRLAATLEPDQPVLLWDVLRRRSVGRVGPALQGIVALDFSPDGFTLGALDGQGALRRIDLLTGTEAPPLELPQGRIESFAFLGVPGRIAVGSTRGGIAIFDAAALEGSATPAEAWERLGSPRPLSIPSSPPDFALLRSRSGPTPAREIEEALRALEEDDAGKRKNAEERLRSLGDEAEASLRAARAAATSAESKEAIAGLLARLDHPLQASGEMLRRLRLVQVLERIGSPEARALLETLARESPSPRQQAAAASALARMALR